MLCAWCGTFAPDALPLFLTQQAELFARYVPSLSQRGTWCYKCREKVGDMIESIRDRTRQETPMAKVCCVCHRVMQGQVSHGYCPRCSPAKKEAHGDE